MYLKGHLLVGVIPYLDRPISATRDKYLRMEVIPLDLVDGHVMSVKRI